MKLTRKNRIDGLRIVQELGEVRSEHVGPSTSGSHWMAFQDIQKQAEKLGGDAIVGIKVLIESVGQEGDFKCTMSGFAVKTEKQ